MIAKGLFATLGEPDGGRADGLVQAIIDALSVPVKDARGLCVYCNRPFENFVGRKIDEMVGKGVFELWEADLAKVYFDADARLFESGGEQQYEVMVKYADGSILDIGELTREVISCRDTLFQLPLPPRILSRRAGSRHPLPSSRP